MATKPTTRSPHAVWDAHRQNSERGYDGEHDGAGCLFADGVEAGKQCDERGGIDERCVDEEADWGWLRPTVRRGRGSSRRC